MIWHLFLDDERFPGASAPKHTIIARSSAEAIDAVQKFGCPQHIDFDHDLGDDDTSIKFINWFIEAVLDDLIVIPQRFTYAIHSQNPVGRDNINSKMEGLLRMPV